jgi:hypothetical protein
MKKLYLNVDDLAVETFATDVRQARPGTVAGQEVTGVCITRYCADTDACTAGVISCEGTCYETCGGCPSYDGQCTIDDYTCFLDACTGVNCA